MVMLARVLGLGLVLVAAPLAAEPAKPWVPVAVWEARIAPTGGGAGHMVYVPRVTGVTNVPTPGSAWACAATEIVRGADGRVRQESVSILCVLGGAQVGMTIFCAEGGVGDSNSFTIRHKGDEAGYILALRCDQIERPKQQKFTPVERDL